MAANPPVLELDLTEVGSLSRAALNRMLLLEAKLSSEDNQLGTIRVLGASPEIANRLRGTDAFELVESAQLAGGRS